MKNSIHPLANAPARLTAIPGLHIVANLCVEDPAQLEGHLHFKKFIDQQITQYGLSKVGEVYHDFHNGGYTGVVCLTESHLSIHTWPEHLYLTFDIFLSNYMKDNQSVTRTIYGNVCEYFNASVLLEKIIER